MKTRATKGLYQQITGPAAERFRRLLRESGYLRPVFVNRILDAYERELAAAKARPKGNRPYAPPVAKGQHTDVLG